MEPMIDALTSSSLPAEMATTVATQCQAPAVPGEPGMGFRRPLVGDAAGAREEGMELEPHPRRVDEAVPCADPYGDEAVG